MRELAHRWVCELMHKVTEVLLRLNLTYLNEWSWAMIFLAF